MENLSEDIIMLIMKKVGVVDILLNLQKVCRSWRNICKDPALWRSIDMHSNYSYHIITCCSTTRINRTRYVMNDMIKHAIDRSCGQLIDIKLEKHFNVDILKYLTYRKNQLKRLQIVSCKKVTNKGLSKATKNMSSLEELHIYFGNITNAGLKNIGRNCPRLKSLTFDHQGRSIPTAIAKSMPELRHLSLFGNQISNRDLEAILDGCPHLESLDLRECFKLDLYGMPLGLRCSSSIKTLLLPNDSIADYQYGSSINRLYDTDDDDDDYRYVR
ncbi:putative F-box/LRR-repeat protein 23 [Impatiens glandulifera]|uniref:putative F-box/LRR-repeat protein 23 n=1 Tax=Impatiens glandulifera TaxID=253017 RepID=UPI001FB119A3|nr:putative F-box/LRR-repeat protein 23 [Impatiens glandulifera]